MARPRSARHAPSSLAVTVVGRPLGRASAGLADWLASAAPRRARGELSLAILPDARVRALNRLHRGIDAATDVLSFPANDDASHDGSPDQYLGDIAIAEGVARRQAAAFGHPLATELRILALHGLLHLLGYDHERDRGTMRRLEDRLRRRSSLPTGLIARARPASR